MYHWLIKGDSKCCAANKWEWLLLPIGSVIYIILLYSLNELIVVF